MVLFTFKVLSSPNCPCEAAAMASETYERNVPLHHSNATAFFLVNGVHGTCLLTGAPEFGPPRSCLHKGTMIFSTMSFQQRVSHDLESNGIEVNI
jgi:hypothetical protein